MSRRRKPTSLRTQLVVSHLVVAVSALAVAGLLVVILAPRLFDTVHLGGHGPGSGNGLGRLRPQVIAAMQHALWWGTLVGLLAAGLFGALAARRVARSVDQVRLATRRLAAGDYRAELPSPDSTELAALTTDVADLADRLARTEQRRTRLLGEVGHEMRTPLTVIDARLEAMIDQVLPATPENLAVLAAETARLRRLANDLGSLSRAEEGRVELQLGPTDLSEVARQVAERLRPQATDAGLSLQLRADRNVVVWADPDRVGQILSNLVGNAIRATPPGGEVTVDCRATADGARISVSDTGEGLRPEDLEQIFERFYRVPGRREPGSTKGSGIGLTIARHLAAAHGGSLDAASPGPGLGATFVLNLPNRPTPVDAQ